MPFEQIIAAPAARQEVVQSPQWFASRETSAQKLPQSMERSGHLGIASWQMPESHDSLLLQPLPHDPQFLGSVARSTHLPEQAVYGLLHVIDPQLPPAQKVPEGQTLPQPPQFAESELVSTQLPPQDVRPGKQAPAQEPVEQTVPMGQTLPQLPQLALSVKGSTQRPPHT